MTAGGITANQNVSISSPLTVGAPQSWTPAAGTTLTVGAIHTIISDLTLNGAGNTTITGSVDGGGAANSEGAPAGRIIQAGPGLLTFTSAASCADTIMFHGGTLVAGHDGPQLQRRHRSRRPPAPSRQQQHGLRRHAGLQPLGLRRLDPQRRHLAGRRRRPHPGHRRDLRRQRYPGQRRHGRPQLQPAGPQRAQCRDALQYAHHQRHGADDDRRPDRGERRFRQKRPGVAHLYGVGEQLLRTDDRQRRHAARHGRQHPHARRPGQQRRRRLQSERRRHAAGSGVRQRFVHQDRHRRADPRRPQPVRGPDRHQRRHAAAGGAGDRRRLDRQLHHEWFSRLRDRRWDADYRSQRLRQQRHHAGERNVPCRPARLRVYRVQPVHRRSAPQSQYVEHLGVGPMGQFAVFAGLRQPHARQRTAGLHQPRRFRLVLYRRLRQPQRHLDRDLGQ